MTRLLVCIGIGLAVSSVSVGAQAPIEDIVTLAPSANLSDGGCDIQVQTHLDQVINPDASRSPFVIPVGSVFVLTGANVAHIFGSGQGLNVQIRNVVTGDGELVVTVPLQDLSGTYGAGALMLTPGIVVGRGAIICTSLSTPGGVGSAGTAVRRPPEALGEPTARRRGRSRCRESDIRREACEPRA